MGKKASVHWNGAGKEGRGEINTETGQLSSAPYGFGTRFAEETQGTNPEELLAAAHAACLTMAFSFAAKAAGFDTETVDTHADVRLAKDGEGFQIDRIALILKAKVPGMSAETFQEIAQGAKQNCPLSKALASVPEITLDAQLV